MLDVAELSRRKGSRLLFNDLGFRLETGEMLHITGPNGAGKTSLLRILSGLSLPDSGEVRWQGRNIILHREKFHRSLFYLGHAPALSRDLDSIDNLRYACMLAGDVVNRADCIQALKQNGLDDCMRVPVRLLSEGQRRKAALSRLHLSCHRQLWLLDEPFNVLDDESVQELCRVLGAQCNAGGIVVLTTHRPVELEYHFQTITLGGSADQ